MGPPRFLFLWWPGVGWPNRWQKPAAARNLAAAGDLRPLFGRVRRCATVLRVMTHLDRDPVLPRRVTDAGDRTVKVGQANRVDSQAPISAPARLAPVGAPSRIGPPKWVPATRVWVLSVAPSASHIALASSGKHAWSPVSSTNRVGAVTPDAQRRKSALVLSPDHVDSQASGVAKRPKPTSP